MPSTRKARKVRSKSTSSARLSATLPPAGSRSAWRPAHSASHTTRTASTMMSTVRKTSYSVLVTTACIACCVLVRGRGALRLSLGAKRLEMALSMHECRLSIESLRTQPWGWSEGRARGASGHARKLLRLSPD